MSATYYDVLTDAEYEFQQHMMRWGSDGYPIRKVARGWIWHEAFGVQGAPVVYKIKREASQAVENYLDSLRARVSARAKELSAA